MLNDDVGRGAVRERLGRGRERGHPQRRLVRPGDLPGVEDQRAGGPGACGDRLPTGVGQVQLGVEQVERVEDLDVVRVVAGHVGGVLPPDGELALQAAGGRARDLGDVAARAVGEAPPGPTVPRGHSSPAPSPTASASTATTDEQRATGGRRGPAPRRSGAVTVRVAVPSMPVGGVGGSPESSAAACTPLSRARGSRCSSPAMTGAQRPAGARGRHLGVDHGGDRGRRGVPGERAAALHGVPERGAEAPQVRRRVGVAAVEPLRAPCSPASRRASRWW